MCLRLIINCFKCLSKSRTIRSWIVRRVAFNPPRITYALRLQQNFRESQRNETPLLDSQSLCNEANKFMVSPRTYKTKASYQYQKQQQRFPDPIQYPAYSFKLITESYQLTDVELDFEGCLSAYILTTQKQDLIASIYIEVPNSDYILLFSHGNSSDLGIMLNTLLDLAKQCQINIFAYEYSGYGQSTGEPNDISLISNIYAAYEFMVNQLKFQRQKIIVYGYSIGSGPSTFLASKLTVGGLIIHSGLSSGMRILDPNIESFSTDIFPNIDFIQLIVCPVFILHGGEDSMINVVHAEQLAQKCQHLYSVWLVEKGGHNDIDNQGNWREQYIMRLNNFLQCKKLLKRNFIIFLYFLLDCRLVKPVKQRVRDSVHLYEDVIQHRQFRINHSEWEI